MKEDYNQGEIYIARCSTTGMSYVGQAKKYMGENMQKWGTSARWTRHVLESQKANLREYNYEINKAIREHGVHNFEVTKLCDCLLVELDIMEQRYIRDYNTLHPNGYNMTHGGSDGTHCKASTEKCCKERRQRSEAIKQKISASKMGKRRENTVRKREEDEDLPKYITKIRENDVVIG
jgi:group I intron endonuclease